MLNTLRLPLLLIVILYLNACSMAKLTVRASMPMIEGGITALNQETDLHLAEAAFPPNIELVEGMLINDPDNQRLREYAAQAYYGYAYGFVEDEDKPRASRLYQRGLKHGLKALQLAGLQQEHLDGTLTAFENAVKELDEDAIAALFWTASCWAKWIDMNRDQPKPIAELPRAVTLMQQVMHLDEHYYMSGPHIFFGVYYGSRSAMLGGDFKKSEHHFNRAREYNQDKLLIVDLLQAQYLDRQRFDQPAFRNRLNKIINAEDELYPEQALINNIAKRKASLFISKESQWF